MGIVQVVEESNNGAIIFDLLIYSSASDKKTHINTIPILNERLPSHCGLSMFLIGAS